MSKIIVLMGPTASGKTSISIKLAKCFNAEIINADAEQVYKQTNIGTAKVTNEEMEGIKHHLIDFVPLENDYNVKEYQLEGRKILDKLISEDKNVIICGGTGLYIKALLYDYKFSDEEENNYDFSEYSNYELKDKVDSIYKDNNIHVNNRKRLERFLSHYKSTGEVICNNEDKDKPLYNFNLIYLYVDRDILYDRINRRVDIMINNGLIEETNKLRGYDKIKSIIGYKECLLYLDNLITKEECIELIKSNTRKYAKRQFTWFNNQFRDSIKVNVNYDDIDETVSGIIEKVT